MKKEKQVRSYKRRTKSGKTVTVKAHTAKYEAADEKAKEASKKEGAGKELEERKKKPVQLEIPFDKEEEKKVLDEVKETAKKESSKKPAEKKTTKKKSDSVVYKHKYGPKGNGDPKRSAEDNAAASIRESSAAKDALRSSDATTFEQFKRTKGYRDLSPAAKEWAHYYRNGGWLKNSDRKEKSTKKVRPVGSGTNGPTPKRKSEAKVSDGSSKSSGAEITKAIGEKRAHLLFEKALDKGSASVRKGGVKYTISIEDRKDGTYAVYTKQGGTSKAKDRKSSAPIKTSVKTTSASASSPAFTAAEFKEWYRGTGSAADKKVAKALRAQLGRAGYRKLEDEAINNYSSRGHTAMFKRVSGGSASEGKASSAKAEKATSRRYASGAKLNEDGTFVSEKDYKKSLAHRKRKGARISPEEIKAIKMYEKATKEESTKTAQPRPRKK